MKRKYSYPLLQVFHVKFEDVIATTSPTTTINPNGDTIFKEDWLPEENVDGVFDINS